MKPSFVILGCRGSLPAAGKSFKKYGGHTTCFFMKTGQGLIFIDAGTGMATFQESRVKASMPATILFTHLHLDHLLGLPFFSGFDNRQTVLTLMADGSRKNWRKALTNLFAYPYWPVKINQLGARVAFKNLPDRGSSFNLYGVKISWCRLNHPQGSLAYRLDVAGHSVAIVTDHEAGNPGIDSGLAGLCSKAGYLVYDACYTPEESTRYRGWGHSSWREGVNLAKKAEVGELVLTHHHFKRTDAEIDKIVKAARRYFPRTKAAQAGMRVF